MEPYCLCINNVVTPQRNASLVTYDIVDGRCY